MREWLITWPKVLLTCNNFDQILAAKKNYQLGVSACNVIISEFVTLSDSVGRLVYDRPGERFKGGFPQMRQSRLSS